MFTVKKVLCFKSVKTRYGDAWNLSIVETTDGTLVFISSKGMDYKLPGDRFDPSTDPLAPCYAAAGTFSFCVWSWNHAAAKIERLNPETAGMLSRTFEPTEKLMDRLKAERDAAEGKPRKPNFGETIYWNGSGYVDKEGKPIDVGPGSKITTMSARPDVKTSGEFTTIVDDPESDAKRTPVANLAEAIQAANEAIDRFAALLRETTQRESPEHQSDDRSFVIDSPENPITVYTESPSEHPKKLSVVKGFEFHDDSDGRALIIKHENTDADDRFVETWEQFDRFGFRYKFKRSRPMVIRNADRSAEEWRSVKEIVVNPYVDGGEIEVIAETVDPPNLQARFGEITATVPPNPNPINPDAEESTNPLNAPSEPANDGMQSILKDANDAGKEYGTMADLPRKAKEWKDDPKSASFARIGLARARASGCYSEPPTDEDFRILAANGYTPTGIRIDDSPIVDERVAPGA